MFVPTALIDMYKPYVQAIVQMRSYTSTALLAVYKGPSRF